MRNALRKLAYVLLLGPPWMRDPWHETNDDDTEPRVQPTWPDISKRDTRG